LLLAESTELRALAFFFVDLSLIFLPLTAWFSFTSDSSSKLMTITSGCTGFRDGSTFVAAILGPLTSLGIDFYIKKGNIIFKIPSRI
jgi:hypothetical protein